MTTMVVEDSSTMRKIIGLALKAGEYQFIEAENGQDGLDKLAGQEIGLFIVDVNMPVMNGIDFVKNIRAMANYSSTPIIILTTETESDMQTTGKEAGANEWMIKPFKKEALLAKIDLLLK